MTRYELTWQRVAVLGRARGVSGSDAAVASDAWRDFPGAAAQEMKGMTRNPIMLFSNMQNR
ncbi:protein of unknown function [Paraburkholderia kururiensis]